MFRAFVAPAAIVACGLLVSACEPGGAPSAEAGPSVPSEIAAPEPALAAPALGAEVVVSLTCSALSSNEGFTREIKLTGGDGVYTWTRGAKETARYEYWEMKLDGPNSFGVTGEYIEGAPVLKTLSFTGTVVGTTISGEGMRGPRKCTITS